MVSGMTGLYCKVAYTTAVQKVQCQLRNTDQQQKRKNTETDVFSAFLSKGSNKAQWGTDSITTKGSGEIGRY